MPRLFQRPPKYCLQTGTQQATVSLRGKRSCQTLRDLFSGTRLIRHNAKPIAADFLEMSDEERQLLDTRVELALAIRQQREALHLSQKQLGAMLKTSQPTMSETD